MSKVRRQYYSKTIYRLWFQYLKQMDYKSEPLKTIYEDWQLDGIAVSNPDTGEIDEADFNIWWDIHWKDLFGEEDYTSDVQEITDPEEYPDENYIHLNLKIEIPPDRKGTRSGKGSIAIYDEIEKKIGKIIRKKLKTAYRQVARFPISPGQPKLRALEENLEILILSKSNTTQQIEEKASFFDADAKQSARKMRISRGIKAIKTIRKNIEEGTFP